jgi:hypothetical protein
MDRLTIACIIFCLLILVYINRDTIKYGTWNTKMVSVHDEEYKVHRAHSDSMAAARLLSEINKRNETLISQLQKKYISSIVQSSTDNMKNNRIDVIPATEMYSASHDVVELMNSPRYKEYLQERILQLTHNYSSKRMYEISPLNTGENTSYTEDKRTLVFCLRHKTPNSLGEYELHDINTMMFVVLHELSHMMNNTWDHHLDFWILFKFLLMNAVECGIYTPVNYELHPINYCGLMLRYNPLYDNKI